MCTYLTKRGSTYYFRRVIPEDVRPAFDGREQWMQSLKTKVREEAKQRVQHAALRTTELINEARKALTVAQPTGYHSLKLDAVEQNEQALWEWQLENNEYWAERERKERYDPAYQQRAMKARYFAKGKEAARAELMEERRLLHAERAREAAAEAVPLMDLFNGYVAERKPDPATVKRWRPVIDRLKEHLGHDDATLITAKDLVAWKDALLAETVKGGKQRDPKTVREVYLAAVKVVLGWGAENHRLPSDPSKDVTVRVPKRVRTRDPGFSDAEARTILSSALKPVPDALSPKHALARRWVPWLCAYTGARVNELTQLRAEDVTQIEGHWTVKITPEAGGVKSGAFRLVPLHQHLIEQGFLAVVEQQKSGPLFYDPELGRGGKEGNPHHKKVGERLAKWVREIGVSDPAVMPNHGWRHRFKTTARRIGMDVEVRDAIQGHALVTEGQKYGHFPVDVLAAAVAAIPKFQLR